MNTCTDIREALERFHDGELPSAERARVEQHLAACADCAKEARAVAALSHTLSRALTPKVDAARLFGMETRIAATLNAAPEPATGWFAWRRWGLAGGLAFGAVLCAMLIWNPMAGPSHAPSANAAESIESDGSIYITTVPDSDIEIIYVFDMPTEPVAPSRS